MKWSRKIASKYLFRASTYAFVACGFLHCETTLHAQELLSVVEPVPSLELGDAPTVPQDVDVTRPQVLVTTNEPAVEPPTEVEQPDTKVLTRPWWIDELSAAANENTQAVELDQLIWMAVQNSPYVRGLMIEPQIHEARASQALGVFDPTPFMNSIFNDTSNPVGNTLTTGGPSQLNEDLWENSAGVRAKNMRGGSTELSQNMDFRDNNSRFFLPRDQADSKLLLRYTQPLMRGAGKTYNRSSYVVANLSANQSIYESTQAIQQHAFLITQNYWELYTAHAFLKQTDRALESFRALHQRIAGRADLDSLRSQQMRAEAQVARQVAQRARAESQVVAAEAKLRAAIGDTQQLFGTGANLRPATLPNDWRPAFQIEDELTQALSFHPDVLATQARIKSTKVKLQVVENELRPTLNLVMEGYLRGLNGNYNAGSSFGDQFSQGSPSYSAGVAYQRPYRNVAAQAILREKRLEMQKALLDLDHTLLNISADVTSSLAQANASFMELEASVRSTLAIHEELEYLTGRWSNAFLDGNQPGTSLLLDQLLNSEAQLLQTENSWARAQADFMISIAKLRLASGTLLPGIAVGEQ